MLVMVGEKFACIKIIGRADFASSVDFKRLVDELLQKGFAYFVLDLSECVLMDSTFLGVLAGFGLKLAPAQQMDQTSPIELYRPSGRITEVLDNLGVLHLFTIREEPLPACDDSETREFKPVCVGKAEITRACLEAHQTLMAINPRNVSRFKEVAAFLAEDLKKAKS
jgi:anti-anti-sigma regulatory factor